MATVPNLLQYNVAPLWLPAKKYLSRHSAPSTILCLPILQALGIVMDLGNISTCAVLAMSLPSLCTSSTARLQCSLIFTGILTIKIFFASWLYVYMLAGGGYRGPKGTRCNDADIIGNHSAKLLPPGFRRLTSFWNLKPQVDTFDIIAYAERDKCSRWVVWKQYSCI